MIESYRIVSLFPAAPPRETLAPPRETRAPPIIAWLRLESPGGAPAATLIFCHLIKNGAATKMIIVPNMSRHGVKSIPIERHQLEALAWS